MSATLADTVEASGSGEQAARASSAAATPSSSPSPHLDFFSPSFDPLRALQINNIQPPLPSAKPLDNVSQFRKLRLLPQEHPDALPPTEAEAAEARDREVRVP
jgi:hypothetical protein